MAHDSTQASVLPRLQSAVDHMIEHTLTNSFAPQRIRRTCRYLKTIVFSSRVSFEDLVVVLLGVGLERSVPAETLQTTQPPE